MKKFLGFAIAAMMMVACSSDRSQILKVYNWSSYIDEDLIGEFEQWYEEHTGEPVQVVYQVFDINETMLSKIEKGHEDFDVVCPSDYIIERMLKTDLLLPIERDFGETPNYIDGSLSPYIVDQFRHITDGKGKDATEYSVGYMWGFTGFLYNASKVDPEDLRTWDVLHNEKYSGMILIKDAPRDVYSQLLLYFHQDEIRNEDGSFNLEAMDSLMYDCSEASMKQIEDYLCAGRYLVGGWEADFGKESMTQEKAWIDLAWSGDAAWAIDEAAEVGVELDYAVPEEGATVWFDGWVIPKYAKNYSRITYFKYLAAGTYTLYDVYEENGAFCVGYNVDMEASAPGAVMTSFVWNWTPIFQDILQQTADGTIDISADYYEGGECSSLAEFNSELVPEDIQEKVLEVRDQIASGEIVVYAGELKDDKGNVLVAEGETMADEDILAQDFFVENVKGGK